MRILASQSKVMSMNITLLGRSLGYLLDMILLPMMPAMIMLSRFIITIAQGISKLPAPLRSLVTMVGGTIIAFITMMTAISVGVALYKKLNLQLIWLDKNLTKLNVKLMGMSIGGGKAAGGIMPLLSNPIVIGALIGLVGVLILQQSGTLNKIYESGKATRKWLDKNIGNIGIKFSQLLAVVGIFLGKFLEFISLPVKELVNTAGETGSYMFDIGKLIWDYLMKTLGNVVDLGAKILEAIITWVKASLLNVIDAGKKLLDTFVEWIKSGFQDPVGFVTKVLDIILEMITNQLSISTTLASDITTAIVEFVKSNLSELKDLALGVTERTAGFDFRSLGDIVPLMYVLKRLGVPSFATGGTMPHDGLAYLHKNETITPSGGSTSSVTVNLTVNGAMDNRAIDEVIRKLKLELGRVRG
jgi:hypothetical protein